MAIEAEPELLTLAEAAKLLRLELSTLRSWRLKQCHLPFLKMGRLVFLRRADVEAFIAASIVPPIKGGAE
jgi:excisionase family DNA binding protein